jgi:Effector Associated Constant Component 1
VEAKITVRGTDADVESLADWLRHEPSLRGRVTMGTSLLQDGEMGAATELLVALASGAGGAAIGTFAGGAISATAKSLSNWLCERGHRRRCDVTVEVTRPDGSQVSVTVRQAVGSESLLRTVLEAATADLAPPSDQSAEE